MMTARTPGPRRSAVFVCACAAAALLASPAALCAGTVTLTGTAGVGGASKPGRWTPVVVVVEANGADAIGTLVIQWGDASAERPIGVPPGARKRFEFYLHTMDAAAAASARLVHDGTVIASVELPLRARPAEEFFTLCVADGAAALEASEGCTATTPAAALPRSVRGYDAVDSVEWRAGSEATLSQDQRLALARWQALRALDEAGSLAATDRPPSIMAALARKNRAGLEARMAIALYVLLLVTAAIALRRRHPSMVYACLLVLIASGMAGAAAAGRAGPGSAVIVHHATLIQQLPGSLGSIVTMRGAAEFPAFDDYALHATVADAALEAGPRQTLEEDGYPRLRGVFGAGARQAFTLEAAIGFRPLTVTSRGGGARIENTSSTDLRDCRFADGASIATLDILKAGSAVETKLHGDVVGPIVSCVMPGLPAPFAEATHAVRADGRSLVVAYLTPAGGSQ